MSFQAYLDNIERKTGKTPMDFIQLAKAKSIDQDTTSADIVTWLKEDYELGHGHAMALVHVIKHGAKISETHVRSGKSHSDDSATLRLDGLQNRDS